MFKLIPQSRRYDYDAPHPVKGGWVVMFDQMLERDDGRRFRISTIGCGADRKSAMEDAIDDIALRLHGVGRLLRK